MSLFGYLDLDPNSPDFNKSVVEAISRLLRIVEGEIEIGDPQHPQDDGSATLAGSGTPTTHNGRVVNIRGSWVELNVTAADTAVTCTHNLSIPVAVTGEPNVLWTVKRCIHSGTAANAASTWSVNFEVGDTVGTDAIQLRFYAAGARTVNADNPLKVTLFFEPAVRRP
jgi:hypothetical protein